MNSTSAQDEDAILSSPKGSTSSKSPESPSNIATTSVPTQAKKVVLKRKLLQSVSLTDSESQKTCTESKVLKLTDEKSDQNTSESASSNGGAESGVVKLSQLTMKERLELRAKKFGAAPTGEVAKIARAERFGITRITATSSDGGSITTSKIAPDVDLLKKRAERFGGSVSNTMVTIEQKEKLQKRQARFGAAAASVATVSGETKEITTPVNTGAANDYAEKAKLRLERFKTTA